MSLEKSMDMTTRFTAKVMEKVEEKHLSLLNMEFHSGEVISDKINNNFYVGIINSGSVDVYSTSVDGNDIKMNTLLQGESFGISNLMVNAGLETLLMCNAPCQISFLKKAIFIELLNHDAELAMQYATVCGQKLKFLLKRIETLTMQTTQKKIILYFLSIKDDSNKVHLVQSREELAKYLGISRAALYRELAILQENGFISISRQNIRLLDVETLEQMLYI